MKRKNCLLAILWPVLNATAQPVPAPHPLVIGDTVPEVFFDSVLHYPTATARLSDFRGKLVILDLWSCFCHPCLSLFPHLDSLQRKYKDQLQVLLVNSKSSLYHDDSPKILRVLEKLQARARVTIDLPIIHHSEELDAWFPAKSLPHEVWIDQRGVVIAITASFDVTELNIESILAGKKTDMHFKNDNIVFDETLPLFINGNGGDGNEMKFHSILTGYIDGIGGTGIEHEEGVTRYHSRNASLFSLVKYAYPEYAELTEHRFILESGNKIFSPAPTDPAFYDNLYCYELIIPLADEATLRRYMKQDLQR
ncbi:MAG TPA: TlpA disulfide reductase family protein, partial [Chitinophagaceae bacterium]|nr:TlpA disulfide reductase family protein [Chitinophagaceae bacterium]